MTGFTSKKKSAEVRWLGPYAPHERHAYDTTVADLVRLRWENNYIKESLDFYKKQHLDMMDLIESLTRQLVEAKNCACRKRDKELEQMFEEMSK